MQKTRSLAPLIKYERPANRSPGQIQVDAAENSGIHVGDRQFWLDGSAIISGVVIESSSDLKNVVPHSAASWSIARIANWWAENAKNPSALYVADQEAGWVACLPDPLGGALAFYSERDSEFLISTQLGRIVSELGQRGHAPKKSVSFQIERLIFGNGGLTHSSYDNIQTIQPFEYLLVKNNQVTISNYSVYDDLRKLSRFELFNILREDLLSSVSAISKSKNHQRISHLTGGFDSRLVLSAVLHLNLKDSFIFFCSGPEGSTDRVIADGLTREFGLIRSTGAGLTNAPTNVMSERLMGALFDSSGLTNTGPQGREIQVSASAMGGGYGEILRTFYGSRTITSSTNSFNTELLLDKYIPKSSTAYQYVAPQSMGYLKSILVDQFNQLSEKYNDGNFLGDAFYTHVRNRYHIGQSSLLWSRIGNRYDPLYSVAGYCLAANSTQKVRNSNVVGFDLMESLKPTLLSFPFDYDRHNEHLALLRVKKAPSGWLSAKKKFVSVNSLSPNASDSSPFLDVLNTLNVSEQSPSASERQRLINKANSMGANYWQVAYQSVGQDLLQKAYENTSNSELFEHIDSEYVKNLFSKEDLRRSELRELYNLGAIMAWLSFG